MPVMSAETIGSGQVTGETSQFLIQFAKSHRDIKDLTRLQKNPAIKESMGGYEEDLDNYLRGSEKIILLGNNLSESQAKSDFLALRLQEDTQKTHQLAATLAKQTEESNHQKKLLEQTIAQAGKEGVIHAGDYERILGRFQVKLERLQRRNNLNFLGWIIAKTKVIKPQREHPIILQHEQKTATLLQRLDSQSGSKDDYMKDYIMEKTHLASLGEEVMQQLDQWATDRWDRLLIHYLYYPERRFMLIQQYKGNNQNDRPILLNKLQSYNLLPEEFQSALGDQVPKELADQASNQDTENSHINILPVKLRINGQSFDNLEAAKQEFFSLKKGLAETTRERQWEKLVELSSDLAQGEKPKNFTRFKSEDLIKRVGGKSRLRVGRYRIIINVTKESGEQMLEVVDILHRDDKSYY